MVTEKSNYISTGGFN